MQESKSPPRVTLFLTVLALLAFGAVSLRAEDVFVTAKMGAGNGGATETGCPPSCFENLNSTWGSSARSTVSDPAPTIPASDRYADVSYILNTIWKVTPTDIIVSYNNKEWTFQACQNVGIYKVYVTKGGAIGTSASPDVEVTVTVDEYTTLYDLSDPNGSTPLASLTTTAFQRGQPNDAWVPVCFIRNTNPNPTVIFENTSGTMSGSSRWYCDAVRFQFIDPCSDVTPQASVAGPLAAGQTYVNVIVAAEARNVTVYADAAQIGITNNAAGFAGGTLQVNTTALVKDQAITATQIKLNQQGHQCPSSPGTARPVGGGPNAALAFFGSVFKTPALTGPVGADGAAVGFAYAMPCTAWSYGAPPVGGLNIVPSGCWQTISFLPTVDPAREYNGGTLGDFSTDNFCSLAGLVINQVDPDSGPYEIYVDQIMNGDTVVEDFENYDVDSVSTFVAPSAVILPDPATTYLPPNSSTISTAYAYDGTKSCRISWQWTTAGGRFARVLTSGANGGKVYPQLDPKQPISFKILVLPVGVTTSSKFNGVVGAITNATPAWATSIKTLGVTVTGSGTYTYQWTWSGGDLPNPTTERTYTIDGYGGGLSTFDDGTYTVAVSDGNCTETRSAVLTVLDPIPTITNQPADAILVKGSTATAMSVEADGHVPVGYPLYYLWRRNGTELYDKTDANLSFPGGAALSDVGSYDVVVQNAYGSVTSVVAQLSVTSVAPGTGTGLRADYWSNRSYTNGFGGAPTLTRVDSKVDFLWDTGSPDASITSDLFMARWTGEVQALGTDSYTFSTVSDDGVRLWINGQKLVDNWTLHSSETNSANIALTGTQKYDLVMEFFENSGGAVAQLLWTTTSGSINWTAVPKSQLYPAAEAPRPVLGYSVNNGTDLVFNWGPGTYNLVWATDVLGPYTNVIVNAASPCTVVIGTDPQRFYRLQIQ